MNCCLCYFRFRIFFFFSLSITILLLFRSFGLQNVVCWFQVFWIFEFIEMSLNSMFLFWKFNHTIFNSDVFPALYFQFDTFFFLLEPNRIVCMCVHCQKHWINRQFHCFHILYRTEKNKMKTEIERGRSELSNSTVMLFSN